MKNRKSFLKGALCGAIAMLLVAGLVSCGLKVNNGNSDITSKTEDKIIENITIKNDAESEVKSLSLEELMKELIFWNKAISFSQILILVAVLFTILSSNLKGSGKK